MAISQLPKTLESSTKAQIEGLDVLDFFFTWGVFSIDKLKSKNTNLKRSVLC